MANLSAVAERPVSLPDTIPSDWKWQNLVACCRPKQWPTIGKKELLSEGYEVYGANGFIGYYSEYTHKNETIAITCRGATCGTVNLVPPETYITGNAMALDNLDSGKVDQPFLYYALIQRALSDVVSGSAQPQITGQGLKKVLFPLPPLPEQKKIAEILGSVDEAIAKTEAVIKQTQRVKQGLLQTLLTRGIGHTKFKQTELGEIPESWEVKTIQESCFVDNKLRKPIKAADRKNMVGPYPYYGPTKILNHIDEYRAEGDYVLIGEDGDHFLKYKTWPMTQWATGKFNVNNHAHLLRGNEECLTRWLYYFFLHRNIVPFLTRQGAGRYKLRKATLLELQLVLPSIEEQNKICQILDAVYIADEPEQKRLEILQHLKTGLMADLLTGRVRVSVDQLQEDAA
jgi:type I restriction enzyme S subunit